MKKLFSDSAKLYLQVFLASFLCFIICTSISSLFYSLGTHVIGYRLYEMGEDGKPQYVGEPYYFQTEDEEPPKDKLYETIRSERPKYSLILEGVLSQSIMLVLFVSFINTRISKIAYSDRTADMYQGQKKNIYKGFIFGGIASIPAIAFYIYLLILKIIGSQVSILTLVRIANAAFLPLVNAIVGSAQKLTEISYGSFALLIIPILILPIVTGISYIFNYKQISIKDKIMYKN
jgi:hypothetical protein